ncbi:PAS domain S-box protein [Massilia sp. YIM B02763]|uniref:PAS domain S-box protein n=1 Tax=Massilia sp. YIM B02763 TaxID=3050130 RepID=UPI0025B66FD5|nr:PAS domain S-box protein [Massilia sp. YIM B02763]MDN4054011.1 PAS domain S-box protein [Massilia sp. YIM B02763]
MSTQAVPIRAFGTAGGAVGQIIDDFDWSKTSLGPIGAWPAVVRTTVELILRSPLPMVTMWGEDGVIIYNAGYAQLAGARHPRSLGGKVREEWPEIADFNDRVLRTVLAGGALDFHDEEFTLQRNGRPEQAWFDLGYSPVVDEAGRIAGVLAVVVETTGKVRAERRLAGEHARLQALFEQAPGFMAILTGPDHVFGGANPAYRELVGGRDVVGKPVRDAVPEAVPQGLVALLDQAYLSGASVAAAGREVWLAGADGVRRQAYLDFVNQPLRGEDGAVFGVFVQGQDVTERVRAQAHLRESEAKFHTFAQAMPHQVWTAGPDGNLDWFNDHVVAYTGLDHAALRGIGWTAVVHPDDLQATRTRWATAIAGGAPYQHEFRLRAANGRYRWHLARAVPLRGEDGGTLRWVGTHTDIEDHKVATERLATLNADLEARVARRTAERDRMWKLSRDVMLVADVDGVVEAVSPAFGSILGWSEHDIVGKNIMGLVHPDDQAATVAQLASLRAGHYVYKFENRYRRKDGSWCLLSWSASPDRGFIHAIGRDITADREQAEQIRRTELALQQSQKMETIGKLTGGVAHDFNNLLQIISGNLQLLEMDPGGAEVPRWIANARLAVEKGAKLASYLLAFGRRQPLEPKVVKVSRVVTGMEDMLRRALGEEIEVELVMSGGLWNTAVDVAQVENAVLNLAVNARDAMGGAGKLTIEASNALLDDMYCRAHADVAPGQYVLLAVTDTGSGMDPDVLRQAFEPFFSTKEEGKGTGLGLSMVYGFVKQSGGHVKIYSEPGQGTTVKIYLPRTTAAEDALGPVEPQQPAVGGTETILVAEDDEAVRTTVVEMLTELGYRVLKAADAASALAVVESGVQIDVLFTDVVMPGLLRSPELARMARERLPNLAVLFTSGYTENAIVHGGRLDPGVELLGKPYTRESLARRIRQVLANQRQRGHAEPQLPAPAAGAGARLRIVLVEDEDEIRDSTAMLLRHLGHEVLEAVDAEQAVGLISDRADVLITDVQLPGMSGDLLAAQARSMAPGIRIVFATGKGEVNNWPDAVVLRKPYNLAALMEVLAAAA